MILSLCVTTAQLIHPFSHRRTLELFPLLAAVNMAVQGLARTPIFIALGTLPESGMTRSCADCVTPEGLPDGLPQQRHHFHSHQQAVRLHLLDILTDAYYAAFGVQPSQWV